MNISLIIKKFKKKAINKKIETNKLIRLHIITELIKFVGVLFSKNYFKCKHKNYRFLFSFDDEQLRKLFFVEEML